MSSPFPKIKSRCRLASRALLATGAIYSGLIPAACKSRESASPANLGFEKGTDGWDFGKDPGRSRVLPEAARSGSRGLRIDEPGGKPGALVTSKDYEVSPGQGVRLAFQARAVKNRAGCGVALRFYDASGRLLNNKPYPHDIDIIVANQPPENGWRAYTLESLAPEHSAKVRIHIATWGNPVALDVDDLQLTPFTPVIQPPWTPSYKLTPADKDKLTAADIVGPDGLVYPDWSRSGVPGGIPAVKTRVGPETFAALEGKDISAALEEAVRKAAAEGGGAIELPAGTFHLDRTVVISENGIVLRGAGREKTRLVFRDRIPFGTLRLFNWSGRGEDYAPGATAELQANPMGLESLTLSCGNIILSEAVRKMHWGNTYQTRVETRTLLERLGPGAHELTGKATYADGREFTQTFPIRLDPRPVPAPASSFNAAIIFAGKGSDSKRVPLAKDARRGDVSLALAGSPGWTKGDFIRLVGPTTPRWNQIVGNRVPWGLLRGGIFEIGETDGATVKLNQPVRIDFPTIDGSYAERLSLLEGCGIEGLTLEQEPVTADQGQPRDKITLWFPTENLWTNGVTFSFCVGGWMRDVRVVNAGRHPVYFPNSKFCEVRNCEFDDSLFKGGGGTAYVGFESSFDCLMDSVVTRKMRHAPDIQWGASGNVIRNSKFHGSDAQFHAGWTNENLLEGNLVEADADDIKNGGYGHGIFATGPSSSEHGPQGPRNVIYNNDVVAPEDGLHMEGGNENWLILHNRFRLTQGYGVYARQKSFDHVIKDNVFVIQRPRETVMFFGAADCTGIDVLDNRYYGAPTRWTYFRSGVGQLGQDSGNATLPLAEAATAARPAPAVESIFLWQKQHVPAR